MSERMCVYTAGRQTTPTRHKFSRGRPVLWPFHSIDVMPFQQQLLPWAAWTGVCMRDYLHGTRRPAPLSSSPEEQVEPSSFAGNGSVCQEHLQR